MEAFLLLADVAKSEGPTGKIGILGGGWSITGPGNPTMSVVLIVRATAQEALQPFKFVLRLVDLAGEPVLLEMSPGHHLPLEFTGNIQLANPEEPRDELTDSVGVHGNFSINVRTIPIPSGRAYKWVLEADGEELASVAFAVRPDPLAEPAPDAEPS